MPVHHPTVRAPRPMDHCSSAAKHASPTAFLSRVWCCFSSSFRINKSTPPSPTSTYSIMAQHLDFKAIILYINARRQNNHTGLRGDNIAISAKRLSSEKNGRRCAHR